MRISVRGLVGLFGAITAAGFCVAVFTSLYTLSELKVGGPIYDQLKRGNDLVADILPPPAYVIEAYLEATLAKQNPNAADQHRQQLLKLRRDYDERHAFWTQSALTPDLKTGLTQASHREVLRFFDAIDGKLFPALARGDTVASNQAYKAVQEAYAAHRAIIDDLVARTNALNTATEQDSAQRAAWLQMIVWSVSGLILLLIVAGVVGIMMAVVKPIGRMTDAMTLLADGKTETQIPALGRRDEIGAMAKAVEVFRDGMISNRALEERAALDREAAEAERHSAMLALADRFDAAVGDVVDRLQTSSKNMEDEAQQMNALAGQTSEQSSSVSSAAYEAATNVHAVASSAEELSASIGEINRQVERSSQMSQVAVHEIESAARTVADLSVAATRIDSIVDMIMKIASQTNLLALNATIEAARAGEAGRGFAVVASEVKNLATQTASATSEIASQLAAIQASTGTAVNAIEGVTATVREINDAASSIAATVEQQGIATREIVAAIAQASVGTHVVTETITSVAAAAAQTGSASQDMVSACADLSGEATALRQQVQSFLSTVRAA